MKSFRKLFNNYRIYFLLGIFIVYLFYWIIRIIPIFVPKNRENFTQQYPGGITAVRPIGSVKILDYINYQIGFYHSDAREFSQLPITKDMLIKKLYEMSGDGYVFTITLKLNQEQSQKLWKKCLKNKNYSIFGSGTTMVYHPQGVYGLEDEFDRISYTSGDIGCFRTKPSRENGIAFSEFNKTKGEFSMMRNESP